ncbi:MAG: hypothetical protein ABSG73_14500 [Candidatus Aminicenantales bacterium]|jgi:hypothetical protein
MTYETEFINSTSRPITVWDTTGPPLFAILPGNRRTLESVSPRTLYSRYSRVEWAPDGGVVLTPRPGFEMPQAAFGEWPIVLRNMDGGDVETRELEGVGEVHVPRGIPVIVSCPLSSPLAACKELRIAVTAEWVESRTFRGYAYRRESLRDDWIERGEADLRRLDEILAKAGSER